MINLKKNKLKFAQLKKKPTENFLLKYYKEIYFQNNKAYYKKKYNNDEQTYINSKIKQKYQNINRLRKSKLVGKVLDIGCGKCEFISFFKKKGWEVTGIEQSEYSLNNKSIKNSVLIGNANEIIKRLIKQNKKYDLISLNNVLEHLLDPVIIINLIKKLLKKNAILSINIPNDESLFQKFLIKNKIVKRNYWVAYPDHINYFNIKSFEYFINQLGLKVLDSISDFPIELFLLNSNSNYVENKSTGRGAHLSRIKFEIFLMNNFKIDEINEYYRSMSKLGIGRNINYLCKYK